MWAKALAWGKSILSSLKKTVTDWAVKLGLIKLGEKIGILKTRNEQNEEALKDGQDFRDIQNDSAGMSDDELDERLHYRD